MNRPPPGNATHTQVLQASFSSFVLHSICQHCLLLVKTDSVGKEYAISMQGEDATELLNACAGGPVRSVLRGLCGALHPQQAPASCQGLPGSIPFLVSLNATTHNNICSNAIDDSQEHTLPHLCPCWYIHCLSFQLCRDWASPYYLYSPF